MADTWKLNDLITRTEEIVQADNAQARNLQRMIRNGIESAVERYTRDAPRLKFNTLTGTDSARYTLTDFNANNGDTIWSVEFPLGKEEAQYLDFKQFQLYQEDEDTWQLLFTDQAIAEGEDFKVVWTQPHTIATVYQAHKQAFAYLCAHFVAASIAASEANRQDSTVAAGTVDKGTGATAWQSRSREFFNEYKLVVLPIEDDDNDAAEVTTSVESTFAGYGRARVFHRYEPDRASADDFFTA